MPDSTHPTEGKGMRPNPLTPGCFMLEHVGSEPPGSDLGRSACCCTSQLLLILAGAEKKPWLSPLSSFFCQFGRSMLRESLTSRRKFLRGFGPSFRDLDHLHWHSEVQQLPPPPTRNASGFGAPRVSVGSPSPRSQITVAAAT